MRMKAKRIRNINQQSDRHCSRVRLVARACHLVGLKGTLGPHGYGLRLTTTREENSLGTAFCVSTHKIEQFSFERPVQEVPIAKTQASVR